MKQICAIFFITSACLLAACGDNNKQPANHTATSTEMATNSVIEKTYTVAMVDNKKDPTCGMPTTAGISDTAHYENKVLGFCSTECKAEFLKNPKANMAAAALK